MKQIIPFCFSLIVGISTVAEVSAHCEHTPFCEICDIVPDSLILSDPLALFDSMPQPNVNYDILNLSLIPKVFSGYQKIPELPAFSKKPLKYNLSVMTPEIIVEEAEVTDSLGNESQEILELVTPDEILSIVTDETSPQLPSIQRYKTPKWLKDAILSAAFQENMQYAYMIDNPLAIEYAYWDLPLPPVLMEEDRSFMAFLKKQEVPIVDVNDAVIPDIEVKKKHWLHTVGALLQFSQAYVSPNWYQGGNNYLSLLFGFNWNVNLNQVFHPKLLFQSNLQYKMALSSNPKGYKHRYTIAEDNFQYNLNLGLKAAKEWYYSYNLQFKTQLLNNYEENSYVRTASFLSPGDLNMGVGMTYSHQNKLKTVNLTLSISPLSYNLKTCISSKVNHEAYSIPQDKKTKSEIGSNLDFTMDWKITANISYKTRMFMFTDYKYFLADWQNTFNFDINKFLSTQLFLHLRYDGSTDTSSGKWKKFMMREILSFGLSYTFSTKP